MSKFRKLDHENHLLQPPLKSRGSIARSPEAIVFFSISSSLLEMIPFLALIVTTSLLASFGHSLSLFVQLQCSRLICCFNVAVICLLLKRKLWYSHRMEASMALKEHYYYPLFIDEEIEAEGGESVCLRFCC